MSGPGSGDHKIVKGSRRPPSPPSPDSHKLQYDTNFMQQQQRNAALHHQRNAFGYGHQRFHAPTSGSPYENPNAAENRPYMNSRPNTTFNSPEPGQAHIGQYGGPEFQGPYHNPYNHSLGIQYDGYGSPLYGQGGSIDFHGYPEIQGPQYEQHHGSAYYTHPGRQQPHYPIPAGYYTNSPPTPAASDQSGGRGRAKGNHRPIAPNGFIETPRASPDDVRRSSRASRRKASDRPVRRVKPGRSTKQKREVPPLTAPLSELTKSYDNIPIKDMNEWVNRSVEKRLQECGKKEGYIPRPMNSFMMYRSAYAERTKNWCLQNNHQVVSSVSGESWPMEPPEIRDLYIEYARQERENHAKAHPDYKFCPSKADAPSRRKRTTTTNEPDDDESVTLEEPDYDWQPSKRKNTKGKARARRAKPLPHKPTYPAQLEFQNEYEAHAQPRPFNTEQSTFEFNNPGQNCPPRLGSLQLGEYYQTVVNSNSLGTARVEDVSLRKAEGPQSHYAYAQPLLGLPGAHHYELLDQQPGEASSLVTSDPHAALPLDPQLDPLFSEFDLDQLGTLDSSLSELIFKDFNQAGLFESLHGESRQRNGSQQEYEDGADNVYQNSPRNEYPNEYQNGYQNVYRDLYENEDQDGDHEEQPSEHKNISEDLLSPKSSRTTRPRMKIEKLEHEPGDDEPRSKLESPKGVA